MSRAERNDKNCEFRILIAELLAKGYNQSAIANHCGVSRQRISAILKDMDKEAKHETH